MRPPWLPMLATATAGFLALWLVPWGAFAAQKTPVVWAVGVLLAGLAAHRLIARRDAGDARVLALLAAVQIVFAATATIDVALLGPVLLWTASAPALLVAATGATPRPAIGAAPAVALVAALAFVATPRFAGGPEVTAGPSLTGFSPEVALGDLEGLFEDPTPVVDVAVEGPVVEPLRLRGAVLDTFDGRAWTARSPRAPFEGAGEGDLRVVIEESSIVENVLLVVGDPVRVEIDDVAVARDADGTLWVDHPDRALRYVVHARSTSEGALDEADRARLVALPDLDARVADLATTLAPGGDATAVAEAVRGALADLDYTRATRDRGEEEPLAAFLFERRSGHCEYFASAAAVLLRARGVPARLVTGFAGGERTAAGWRFRRAHAHAWVEFHDGAGWRVLDATPGPKPPRAPAFALRARDAVRAAWVDRVLGYDRGAQIGWALGFGRGVARAVGVPGAAGPWAGLALGGAALAAGLVAVALGARRWLAGLAGERAPAPKGRVAAAHARAWRALRRRGWDVPEALPPVAAARYVRRRAGEVAAPLERLAWLHYAVRYGGADDGSLAAEAAACERDAEGIPAPSTAAPPVVASGA